METPTGETLPECPGCRELLACLRESEARLLELETRLRDLEDKLKPPSPKRPQEPIGPAPAKKPTGKKRGAQPGHPPHLKKWLPRERVTKFVAHLPKSCAKCDKALSPEAGPDDPEPTIHQIVELPLHPVEITQHEGHYRTCVCGHVTHCAIPAVLRAHTIDSRLTAALVTLAGEQGISKRGIEETCERMLQVPISLGTLANLEREASAALEAAYREVREHVADAPVKNIDETGWKQAGKKRWLWAAATANAVLFLIHPRRNLDALKHLLGKLSGILVSDRWKIYDEWDDDERQLCWAHVKRNWEKQIERGGLAATLGNQWLDHQKQVFELWHRFRDRPDSAELDRLLPPLVEAMGGLLHRGIAGRDAKLSRFCAALLERYPMYWLFATTPGVEPTNNHAERVQRKAVLWRRRSFGCQSAEGCRFVERILTVVQTLRLQGRNSLEFLAESIAAHRNGSPAPKLCRVG